MLYRVSKVLSIDPGSTHLGMAVLEVNHFTNQVKVIHVHTFLIDNVVRHAFSNYEFIYGTSAARLYAIGELVYNMLTVWGIDDVASEAPYMGRFPRAFEVLTYCMATIKAALVRYYGDKPLVIYDPATVKVAMGVRGNSKDKPAVAMALTQQPYLDLNGFDINYLDEHSTDAIAVGCTYAKRLLGGVI